MDFLLMVCAESKIVNLICLQRIQKAKRKCIAGIKRKRRRLSKVAKQTKAYEYAHPDIASPSNGSHSFDMLSNDVTPTNASLLNDLSKKCKRVAQVNSDHETSKYGTEKNKHLEL